MILPSHTLYCIFSVHVNWWRVDHMARGGLINISYWNFLEMVGGSWSFIPEGASHQRMKPIQKRQRWTLVSTGVYGWHNFRSRDRHKWREQKEGLGFPFRKTKTFTSLFSYLKVGFFHFQLSPKFPIAFQTLSILHQKLFSGCKGKQEVFLLPLHPTAVGQ